MMKKLSVLLCLCLFFSLFGGCRNEMAETTPTGEMTEPSTENLSATSTKLPPTGTLETERLEIAPWDSGRAERSGRFFVAETESGFYLQFSGVLFYADKANLNTWVAVCPDPDCKHRNCDYDCNAHVPCTFILKDDRIYYDSYEDIDPAENAMELGTVIKSLALDGTDKRVDHIYGIPEGIMRSKSYSGTSFVGPDFAIECGAYLNSKGTYDSYIMVVDEEGEWPLFSGVLEEKLPVAQPWANFGEMLFFFQMLDADPSKAYVLEGREPKSVDCRGLPIDLSYYSDEVLWFFRPGDGYYAADLNTGEEVKLAENQLAYSEAYIVQPNCILESTILGWDSQECRDKNQVQQMRFFDGEQWWDVALPEELQEIGDRQYLEFKALASDRMLFELRVGLEHRLYQLMLDSDTPTLEYIGSAIRNEEPY